MEVQPNQAACPQSTTNPESVPIPEESLHPKQAYAQERTLDQEEHPIQEHLALPGKQFHPVIFPYTHANPPKPLAEGTGLYNSPFFTQDVNTVPVQSQGCPLFAKENNSYNLSAFPPQTDDQNSSHAPHGQLFLKSSLLLPISENCKDAATPIAVNETGPVFMESTSDLKENDADRQGTSGGDLFGSTSFAPSHEAFFCSADGNRKEGQGVTKKGNEFSDFQVRNTVGQAPVFVHTANVISETSNNSDGVQNVSQGNSRIQGSERVATTHNANVLCGSMSNAEEDQDITLGTTVTAKVTDTRSEIRGTPTDHLGEDDLIPDAVESDCPAGSETAKYSHENREEEEETAKNSFPRNENDRTTTAARLATDTAATFQEANVHSDIVGIIAQRTENPLEVTEPNNEPKLPGPDIMAIDDGSAKEAYPAPSNAHFDVNALQTLTGCKESSAIRLPPLDILPANCPRLTTTNALAPITGGKPGLFIQDYSSVLTGKEQNGTVLPNFPIMQSSTQVPIPGHSLAYGNPTVRTQSHMFNSVVEQAPRSPYRPRVKSTDIPSSYDSNASLQIPYVVESHNILPGSSSGSSMHQPSDLSTIETPLDSQNCCHQCTDSAAQFSHIPMRGRPPVHRHPQMHRTAAVCVHTSSASQVYAKQSPFMAPVSPFGTASSLNGIRHDLLQVPPTTYTGEPQMREAFGQPHQIPAPAPRQNFSDASRARVIEHPPMRNVKGSRCPYCSKLFKTDKDKQRHVQRMHLLKGRYPCSYAPCKQSFAEAHKLSRHVRTVHLMNRPFKCPHCDSAFGERGNMMQHIRKAHLGNGREGKRARRN